MGMNSYVLLTLILLSHVLMATVLGSSMNEDMMYNNVLTKANIDVENAKVVEDSLDDSSHISGDYDADKRAGNEFTMSSGITNYFAFSFSTYFMIFDNDATGMEKLMILPALILNMITIAYGILTVFLIIKNRKTD